MSATAQVSYRPGKFCWAELGTTDASGAKAFYSSLLGYEVLDMPVGPGMVYSMLKVHGKDAGALYQFGKDQQGVPPHWMNYVSVASAAESTSRAKAAGATVVVEPFDVMGLGNMAVLTDPTGATVSLWEPKQHIGAQHVSGPGSVCWRELLTTDVERAGRFYTEVFGWETTAVPMGPTMYTMCRLGNEDVAGMMTITPEMGPVPPHWGLYFSVADCDQTVAEAQAKGGSSLWPAMDVPNVGRMAGLRDPQGAVFSVVRLIHG